MLVGSTRLVFKSGDIAAEVVDVIVTAANTDLSGGGGVDAAVHKAGGPAILEECRALRERLGRCPTGQAVITGAGLLRARWVVHAVGPRWQGGHRAEDRLLRDAYQNSLMRAAEAGALSVAFPSISTGAYGFPMQRAAPIAVAAVCDALLPSAPFEEVRFVLFSHKDLALYQAALEQRPGH